MQIPKQWTFKSKEIAKGFDSHVREQLPWYDLVTGAIAHIAAHYIPQDGLVYDIGASTGNIGNAIKPILTARNANLIAYEESKEMAAYYNGPGELRVADATQAELIKFDVAICNLVLMFMSIERRISFIADLKRLCKPGGAIVVVDRHDKTSGYLSTVLYRMTLATKLAAGAKPKDILDKELSLAGAQRPITADELDGFEEWFRFGQFAGWIYEA